ncbi:MULTISPECIES: hypothetical protein [Convivina]|nr:MULTISPECIES: hypothetical protein [Convivina]CAH1853909.1 hypothetical protein R078131_00864 [Convivina intestini]CAH1855735.1 hypothetical protein R078138_01200 [Convivina sp. LMG 32447]
MKKDWFDTMLSWGPSKVMSFLFLFVLHVGLAASVWYTVKNIINMIWH